MVEVQSTNLCRQFVEAVSKACRSSVLSTQSPHAVNEELLSIVNLNLSCCTNCSQVSTVGFNLGTERIDISTPW